jgi:transcriptional regulator with XRE-family HTH domain
MNFGQRLAALRNKRHLTQDQVAEALGVKRARYNAWENGISNPDHKNLIAMAQFYRVTVDFLLGLPHTGGSLLLTSDEYADGYTDESYLADLEDQLNQIQMNNTPPAWATSKDIRDFKKMLEDDAPVMFDGVPIEGEARQRVMDILTGLFWEAKEMNKKTYGRKKNNKTNTSENNKE